MKTYGVIKDSVRNMALVIAVKDDKVYSLYGVNEYGKSLAKRIIEIGSIDSKSMPDGVELTDFKELSESASLSFDKYFIQKNNFEMSIDPIIEKEISSTTNNKIFLGRSIVSGSKNASSHSGMQIRKFVTTADKLNIIDFKASFFKSRLKKSSVITPLLAYGIGFDKSKNTIVQKKSKHLTDHSINKINLFVGEGAMRRFAKKTTNPELDGKRLTRRFTSLSNKVKNKSTNKMALQHRYMLSIESRLKKLS